MNELKEIKLWDDWDDINLSTPERRIERLEILLCQKIHQGEDISQCLQVLEYLKNRTTEQKLESVFFQQVQSKLAFNSWQKVSQAALAFLIVITKKGNREQGTLN
jgi:plasmid rolling circle replication initiator protein Rep